eukprot:Clim_evm14s233 gene=Clim_evmTU14s233
MTDFIGSTNKLRDNTDPGWGFSERKGCFGLPVRHWYYITKSGRMMTIFPNNIYALGWVNSILSFIGFNALLSIFAMNGILGLLCVNCFLAVNCVNCAFAVNCINCAFQVGRD